MGYDMENVRAVLLTRRLFSFFFGHQIPQCPCVLEQALADKGRYLPDYDCDIEANPGCFYNKGARHCVRTGAPR